MSTRADQASSGTDPKPLTAQEVQAHPEYPHTNWKLKADKAERIDVAAGRGGPLKISYVDLEYVCANGCISY